VTTDLSHHQAGPSPTGHEPPEIITANLRRWPSAGAAVAVVGNHHSPAQLFLHGVADVASGRPVSDRTLFRVGSLTKTITAVAVMQLSEQGLLDLDAPANDYLRPFQLVPARTGLGPATVRHLLTHTAGIGYWRHRRDLLLHPGLGAGVTGRSVVSPAELYRDGLLIDVEPGTRWMYSNHGFAALGQIVEDATGEPFDLYLREHVFGPLGMHHTDLVLPEQLRVDLATGYRLRRRGLTPVALRPVPIPAGGGVYSTITDMGRYLTALLHGGANEHGRVLDPDSVRSMFAPHFRPDVRVAGMGLGFEPHLERDRVLICKGGTVNGFLAALELSPEDGVGAVVLTNTGGLDNRGIPEPLAAALTRNLLGMPADPLRDDAVPHPEVWDRLRGWYAPDAGPNTNLFMQVGFGAGLEVAARRDHLALRPLHPVPGMSSPMVLHPDDPADPRVFRVLFANYDKTFRVVFTNDRPPRLLLDVMSFEKRPAWTHPRKWATGATVAGAAAAAGHYRKRSA
jgi:CubicO group peptidase (beta-lactamase class C family)